MPDRAGRAATRGTTMVDMNAPIALLLTARRMLNDAAEINIEPQGWELFFGKGALEILGREVRRVTSIERLYDLPVSFPEKPGEMEKAVELLLIAKGGGCRQYISAEMLARSY